MVGAARAEGGEEVSQIGTVPYSGPAYSHMRKMAELVMAAETEAERKQLLREAETVHAFHEEFIGVVMHEVEG